MLATTTNIEPRPEPNQPIFCPQYNSYRLLFSPHYLLLTPPGPILTHFENHVKSVVAMTSIVGILSLVAKSKILGYIG
jgi:hypothetical protein